MSLDYKKLRKKFEVFLESIDQKEFDNWLKKERETESVEKLSINFEYYMAVFEKSIISSSAFDIIKPTTINLSNVDSSYSFTIDTPLSKRNLAKKIKPYSIAA